MFCCVHFFFFIYYIYLFFAVYLRFAWTEISMYNKLYYYNALARVCIVVRKTVCAYRKIISTHVSVRLFVSFYIVSCSTHYRATTAAAARMCLIMEYDSK